jgi:hypothetical protein
MQKLLKTFAIDGVIAASSPEARSWLDWFRKPKRMALSEEDIAALEVVLSDKIHGKSVGTQASWANPNSGNSGTVCLLERLTQNGQICEMIEYGVKFRQQQETYVFTSCLQSDGTWRLARAEEESHPVEKESSIKLVHTSPAP